VEKEKIKRLEKEINEINWSEYNGPVYYDPKKVSGNLVELIHLKDEDQNLNVYNKVLYSIGNNHCGSYYKAIFMALKYIILTAIEGNSETARNCSLNLLTDLYISFYPDANEYTSKLERDKLYNFVQNEIRSISIKLQQRLNDKEESERNKKLITDFLNPIKK
jgi:hypothetical protein